MSKWTTKKCQRSSAYTNASSIKLVSYTDVSRDQRVLTARACTKAPWTHPKRADALNINSWNVNFQGLKKLQQRGLEAFWCTPRWVPFMWRLRIDFPAFAWRCSTPRWNWNHLFVAFSFFFARASRGFAHKETQWPRRSLENERL